MSTSINDFQREYLCDPWEREGIRELDELAEKYHEACESFDRRVCTLRNHKEIAMPANSSEMFLVNRNARGVRDALGAMAANLGFSSEEWHNAIVLAANP